MEEVSIFLVGEAAKGQKKRSVFIYEGLQLMDDAKKLLKAFESVEHGRIVQNTGRPRRTRGFGRPVFLKEASREARSRREWTTNQTQ